MESLVACSVKDLYTKDNLILERVQIWFFFVEVNDLSRWKSDLTWWNETKKNIRIYVIDLLIILSDTIFIKDSILIRTNFSFSFSYKHFVILINLKNFKIAKKKSCIMHLQVYNVIRQENKSKRKMFSFRQWIKKRRTLIASTSIPSCPSSIWNINFVWLCNLECFS